MEEYGNVVAVIVGLLWFVLPVLLRRLRAQKEGTAQVPPTPTVDFHRLARTIEHGRALSEWLVEENKRLEKRVGPSLGPARILSDVLEKMADETDSLRTSLETSADQVAQAQLPYALPDTLALLEWQSAQLAAVEHMIEVRSDRTTGEMMADADAVAAAHLKPLVDFTQFRGIDFPSRRPVCIPAMPGREAVFFGLLPAGYPTVFVPTDFGDDLLRWPAVSHEIGHVVWRELPGFSSELRQALRLEVEPVIASGPRAFDLRRCYAAWLEELFCDYYTVLQLGPPALRGMMAMFSPPNVPAEALVWATASEARYDEHPPPHLRVQLAAHALWMMGYDVEAKLLLRQWTSKVGQQGMYGFPAMITPPFGIAADSVEAFGRALVQRMHEVQLDALAGYPLSSIPGLAMTPGLWARVDKEKEALLSGESKHTDPRVILSAAIEARAASPRSSRALARAVTRAIVGIDEPKGPRKDEDLEVTPTDATDEILEAMVLYQVLDPSRRARRARGMRSSRGERL